MQLTRYYEKQSIDIVHIRAVRDVLKATLKWDFRAASYTLFYESEYYSMETLDEATKLAASMGTPKNVLVSFSSAGGRRASIETRLKRGISIEVNSLDDPPESIIEPIEKALSLKRCGDVPLGRVIATAFIAHAFSDEGQNYANEVARFLGLLGIRCYSGRSFAPKKVSTKVMERLSKHDILIAIVTPQDDLTWLQQEMATGVALEKDLIILKQADAELKPGLLADHEYVMFPEKDISRTFIPIIEGLNELCGIDPGTRLFGRQESRIEWMEGNV